MNDFIASQNVESRIYRIRGQQVIVDTDLADMYEVSAKRLNEQVRRNLKRFPPDFMFQLSTVEEKTLRSQFATLKQTGSGRHRKYRPYVFTEQGVAMLSGVLRSPRAIEVNIAIMRAFVKLRHALVSSRDIARRVEKIEGKVDMHETDIRLLVQDVEALKIRPGPSGPINPYPSIL
jgi:hypothetical protein